MMRALVVSASVYAALVFGIGFVMGVLRTLVVTPRVGEARAILLEVPIMLAVSFLAAGWAAARWEIAPRAAPRLTMGALAFALLMTAEMAFSTLFFERSAAEHLRLLLRPAALPGFAAQVIFGAMPALRLLVPPSRRRKP